MKTLKHLILSSFLSLSALASFGQSNTAAREAFIEDLIGRMTLEEKAGQMTQVTLDVVCEGKPFDEKKVQLIDEERLDSALKVYHLGSILNIGNHTKTPEKWHELISEIQDVAVNETRLGIPVIYGIDAIHGMNYTQGGTLFPQELGLAASWDTSFAHQMAEVTAYEVRASGIPWNFSPVLDLGRQPLWSRMFETLGEDVHLAQQMTKAIIHGYQGNDVADHTKVAACMKHYVGYSNSRSGHDRTPIYMDERVLREYYLPTFETAIEEGAQTVMVNSTEINGEPVHASYHLLTEVLKEELSFDGFVVTDWDDINKLYHTHHIAATPKEAVALAINAGIDMSMVPMDYSFCNYLVELVKEGVVQESRVNDAVRRILRVKYNLGLFDRAFYPWKKYKEFGSQEFQDWSYNAASESITLLENRGKTLPLDKGKKLLVVGPTANSLNALNGAWTHSWQGTDSTYNTKGKLTILEALKAEFGNENVNYVNGAGFTVLENLETIRKKAAQAEVIVVCIGEAPATEKPGDIDNLDLPEAQQTLVKELAKTGLPIVCVLTEARPRIIREIEGLCAAVVTTYLPGDEGGVALADVLSGDVNPSGRLPFTYPRFSGNLTTYDHKWSEEHGHWDETSGFAPQWEFGHGLSYTQFEYSDISLSDSLLTASGELEVTIKITNVGDRAGKEVVQVYGRDEVRSVTPPVKQLVAFEKVNLKPGEERVLKVKLRPEDFSFVNKNLERVTEPGDFQVLVQDFELRFRYDQPTISALTK